MTIEQTFKLRNIVVESGFRARASGESYDTLYVHFPGAKLGKMIYMPGFF